MEKLLKVKDVSELLNVSKSTVYQWVNSDYLPYVVVKRGKRKQTVRFKADTIEKWVKSKERETRKSKQLDNPEDMIQHGGDEYATGKEGR